MKKPPRILFLDSRGPLVRIYNVSILSTDTIYSNIMQFLNNFVNENFIKIVLNKIRDKIAIHCTISIQDTLPGPIEGVRRELEDRIRIYGDGGLIICPSNLIQNDTPMENILEIYRTVNSMT